MLKKGGDEARELANNKVLWEEQVDPNNEMPFDDYSYEERLKVAQEVVQEYNGKVQITVHSITITPEMRDSVMQGQPLFQKSTKEARQAIQDIQGADTKWLFDNYDTGHITLEPITVKTTIGNKTTEYQHSIVSLNNPIGVKLSDNLKQDLIIKVVNLAVNSTKNRTSQMSKPFMFRRLLSKELPMN